MKLIFRHVIFFSKYWGGPPNHTHHLQWISLGHFLLIEEEMTHPISFPDHQCGPVAVSVECEPRTTGSFMPYLPQHGCVVILVERIVRINDKELPFLVLSMLLPHNPHHVDPPPQSPPLFHCRTVLSRRPPWPLPPSPPTHTSPESAVRSSPRLLAVPQGTCRGQ